MLNILGTVRDRDTVSMEYYALLNNVISTDLEQLSKVFSDAKHRAASATAELLVIFFAPCGENFQRIRSVSLA